MTRAYSIMAALGALLLVAGCGETQAVLADLTTDKAVVRMQGDNVMVTNRVAEQGCQIHKRTAVPVTSQCLDQWCTQRALLFACKVPD